MKSTVVQRLLDLNARFYDENAASFSSSRRRLQPGVQNMVRRLLAMTPPPRLLDLGCGNGWLAGYLWKHSFQGQYLGLDSSQGLLDDARLVSPYTFLFSDLSSPGWNLVLGAHTFDVILAFAVLHHLPGAELRLAILQKARNHLAFPGGLLIHSEWQFQNSLRLSARIQPWQEIGIHENEVDEGDALLDWRAGSAVGLRYVHQFNLNELVDLAIQSRFRIAESFLSDGHEQNLSLYQVWEVLP